ncbi:MAG: baseplate J/gp47 family protein [Pseudomonadota bacterium]|nr:baseplate J/gp47 family protein [Pseudomonadota bacterium]
MSSSLTITIPAPPTATSTAAGIMSWMTGQSGVVTDYNTGSQIRTLAESIGAVEEQDGVAGQAQAFQALVYSAYSAFGIYPKTASYATGNITFLTGTGANPPVATQNVSIPKNTIVQTTGGISFQTTAAATIPQGGTSVTVGIIALTSGITGNVNANTITNIVTGLSYTLFCNNYSATSNGAAAESPSATFARFTSAIAAIGLGTPVSIANACIGVSVSGTGEEVQYANCFEPWAYYGTQTPGYTVYIDNGSGAASYDLISQVKSNLNGVQGTSTLGYRPAGVPYSVSGVTPVYSSVIVSGTSTNSNLNPALTQNAVNAIQSTYASLSFSQTLLLSEIIAEIADSTAPYLTNLAVYLQNVSGVSVSGITTLFNERNILQTYTVNII